MKGLRDGQQIVFGSFRMAIRTMLSKSPLKIRRRRLVPVFRRSAMDCAPAEPSAPSAWLGGSGSRSQIARSISLSRVEEMKNGAEPHSSLYSRTPST